MALRRVLADRSRHMLRDISGAGAVEFALIAPILLILFLAGSELGVALTIDRKVKAAAGAAADLASQSTKLEDADFPKLMGIVRGSIAPYSVAPLSMRLTQIRITGKGQGTVDWSCASNGYAKLTKGTPVTIPSEFSVVAQNLLEKLLGTVGVTQSQPAIYIVRGEAKYAFQPVTGEIFADTFTLSGTSFVQPRYSDSVASNSGGCATFALQ